MNEREADYLEDKIKEGGDEELMGEIRPGARSGSNNQGSKSNNSSIKVSGQTSLRQSPSPKKQSPSNSIKSKNNIIVDTNSNFESQKLSKDPSKQSLFSSNNQIQRGESPRVQNIGTMSKKESMTNMNLNNTNTNMNASLNNSIRSRIPSKSPSNANLNTIKENDEHEF